MKKRILGLCAVICLVVATSFSAVAAKQTFGQLFYDGMMVRTVIPPAANPLEGRDNLYAVMGGVVGQLGVVAVAPGDKDYHGGHWAFHLVTWNTPEANRYLLTSEAEVLAAAAGGDVTILRNPAMDFKCPIQP